MAKDFSQLSDDMLAAEIGNADAFAELTARYLRLVSSLCRSWKKVGSLDDDDLIQEGLMGLYSAALSYDPQGGASFKNYALRCVSNRLKNEVRNHSSKKNLPLNDSLSLDSVGAEEADTAVSPEMLLEDRETIAAVLNQIHISLSDFERKVLAQYLSGYKRNEIAENLGISVKAFDNALQRVKRKLKAIHFGKVG